MGAGQDNPCAHQEYLVVSARVSRPADLNAATIDAITNYVSQAVLPAVAAPITPGLLG